MKDQILEAIEDKRLDLSEYSDQHELVDALDYDGRLHEIIDGMIDIYYYDIRKWAVDNWEYIERAVDEGLWDNSGEADYHKMIQAGQYVYYQELAYEAVEEIFEEYQEVNA